MAKTLGVYLHKDFVGHLIQDEGGQMVFDYAESWLEKPCAGPLSQFLPPREERFMRKECRGFFAGILPEESKREIIARYDRVHRQASGGESTVERVHQEDFCQALGIVPEMKYQKEGGPSLKDCFHLLREISSAPVIDLARLLDAMIFNYLVGNNDAHGKNFSLLYPGAGMEDVQVRPTPLYDVVSTIYYP